MKKFLKIVGIVVLLVVLVLVYTAADYYGVLDTRFWSNDPKVYTPFFSGTYIGGVDLKAGSYDVEVRGQVDGTSMYDVFPDKENYILDGTPGKSGGHSTTWINRGEKGFHFTINDGEYITFEIDEHNGMRIKKSNLTE